MSKNIICIVGNPNCGKTTLFNALTGSRQEVGNWPGVTVDKKVGRYSYENNDVEIVDLPGIYSITPASHSGEDERIARDYILTGEAQAVINIVDASNLERNLYLTTQLIEMRVPMMVVVNMLDIAQSHKMRIDLEAIERELGCPVVGVVASREQGVKNLKKRINEFLKNPVVPAERSEFDPRINKAAREIEARLQKMNVDRAGWYALQILEAAPGIEDKLLAMRDFSRMIVNAVCEEDVKVFVTALLRALGKGKRFVYRSAAALAKVMGGVSSRGLLTRQELVGDKAAVTGIVVAGSHVNKTTAQLQALKKCEELCFIEINQHTVVDEAAFRREMDRVVAEAEACLASGRSCAVYTRRERFDLNTGNREDELRLAVKISDAVTSVVARLSIRPDFIIAKGGITSSEIGTKALGCRKARVMGQILKGVPVWETGPESKFPGIPYVIFPGNVGDENALYDAVQKLIR